MSEDSKEARLRRLNYIIMILDIGYLVWLFVLFPVLLFYGSPTVQIVMVSL